MEKISNIIVLSGLACSGKTTIGKALARHLGYVFFSAGSYLRKHVDENLGIDINAYTTCSDAHPEADIDFDRYFKGVVARASEAGVYVVSNDRQIRDTANLHLSVGLFAQLLEELG